jgi:drug/metabolite transporter (DMT)-like permease
VNLSSSLDYAVTLLAALLIGTGFVLQQYAAEREPASRFLSLGLIADLLRKPRWLIGIGCMIGGQVLAAWSIGNLSLSTVEPLLTTNLVFALIVAVPIAKARLRFSEIAGAAVLIIGVALLSASRSAKPIGLSFGSVTHWPAAAVIAAIAFAAVHAGSRRQDRLRPMLTGAGAGLVFGIQDALTRQTLEILSHHGVGAMFTTWAPYALVGAGAVGIWLMQSAFSAGPLPLSLPAIAAGEPLVGITLGVLVFGDYIQITPGELALQACGIVALVAGVILVGRAPALSQLRSWTPPRGLPHITAADHLRRHRDDASAPGRRDRDRDRRPPGEAGLGQPQRRGSKPREGDPAACELFGAELGNGNGAARGGGSVPGRVVPLGVQSPDGGAEHGDAEQQERHDVHAGAVLADAADLEQLSVDQVHHEADADDHRDQP